MENERKYEPLAVWPDTKAKIIRISQTTRRSIVDTVDLMADLYERMGMPEPARETPPTPKQEG